MNKELTLTLLICVGLFAGLGCGGRSADSPPTANNETAQEPVPVEIIEDEQQAVDSPPPSSPEGDSSQESENSDGADSAAAPDNSMQSEEANDATANEAPLPSGDLQSYVGAKTGYTPEYRTVKDNMETFKQCYLDAMRSDPDLSGVLKIRFTVLKSGKVKKAKAVENELNDQVATCIVMEMKKLKFPRRADKRTVEYPFKFIPSPN